MKRIVFITLGLLLFTTHFMTARDIITQDAKQLPQKAREIVEKVFPGTDLSYIKVENETFRSRKYEVKLVNGAEIEFDKKGNWTEVSYKNGIVPASFIPSFISNYIEANIKTQKNIIKIERDRRNYEVELESGLELKFDYKGNLLKIDD